MDTKKKVRKTKAVTPKVVDPVDVVVQEPIEVPEYSTITELELINEEILEQLKNQISNVFKEINLKISDKNKQIIELNEQNQNRRNEEVQLKLEKQNQNLAILQLNAKIELLEKNNNENLEELEATRLEYNNLKIQYDNEYNNLKKQFEQYKAESTNSYSVLKQLYDESKLENKAFSNKIEKLVKENDSIRNEFSTFKGEYNKKLEEEIQSFKNVSILNTYLKKIDDQAKEIEILQQKLNSSKKLLDISNKENKELSNKIEQLSHPDEEEQEEVPDVAEETEDIHVKEQVAFEEIQSETKDVQKEQQEETPAESEEVVEIDVSTLDVIEVDDKEYYLDLDNHILDKETLEILGTVTEDGEANFY